MGDLPEARLTPYERVFTNVGVDYFGPMLVKQNRSLVKTWGVLFTCLTVRAVHLELATSLTTDSCILAIRNFINRRGVPRRIHSDNGTNFRGADRELREVFLKLDLNRISDEFTSATTEWYFNPPSAPHMGGCWERLVQSVKKVLAEITPERNPTEELLRSMLIEVENIVNSRPLTWKPTDDGEYEALTPNHFLLGTSSGVKPIAEPGNVRETLGSNWKTSQLYANRFWRRWVLEYLPELTGRSKWCKKVEPLVVGDVVIVVDEMNYRGSWPKGIIVDTILGSGGQVRRAIVKTATGIYERPATKLARLDVGSSIVGEPLPKGINAPGGSVDASSTFQN